MPIRSILLFLFYKIALTRLDHLRGPDFGLRIRFIPFLKHPQHFTAVHVSIPFPALTLRLLVSLKRSTWTISLYINSLNTIPATILELLERH